MKNLKITFLLIFTAVLSYGQTPCQNGLAGSYPCKDYDLMSRISLATMSAGAGNDSWGWTDPSNGKEYAIIGLNNGTAFIDISNPTNPVYLGKLPTATSNSSWRDVKVYKNHAFIVSEASNHGMQVFDLTRLRNVSNPPQSFNADTRYTQFGNAHNIVINEDSGYAYVVGAQRNSGPYRGGPLFINIQDPKNPINAGGFLSGGQRAYTHDAQVVTYNGPDATYAGREILIGSNEIEVVIADITDKANPVTLSTIKYPDVGYTHQGWFTEDMRYFILGDETDEQGVGFNTRTIVFDFLDLDNPKEHLIYTGPTAAIDHNGYVKGDKFYLANYRAGIRVIDISDIGNKNMTEIGFFDTYTSSNGAAFNGVWNVYPYFNSGNIVISDIEGGFFLVKKSSPAVCNATTPSSLSASNISSSSALLNWSSVSGTTYDLRYRVAGSSAWTTTAVSATSSTISGLSASTQYEAQVRSKCPDGSTSQYSSSTTFTTTGGNPPNNCSNTISSFPFTESFETNLGQWSDATSGDDLNWTRNSGGTPSNGTGPSSAVDGNTYIYVEASGNGTGFPNKRAILNSPCLDFSALTTPSLSFQYHMLGSAVETLTVEARTNNTGNWTSIFSRAGTQGSDWNLADVDLSAYAGENSVQIRFNVVTGDGNQGWQSDIALDIITIQNGNTGPSGCTSGISSFPYNESFENTLGAWTQSAADDIDWTVDSNGTPSRSTGPSSANQGTFYIYVEASGNGTGYPNKSAILNSPCIDLSAASTASFSFAYHMFGAADMGSIDLEVSTDEGGSWTSIWNQTGNQGNAWNTVNINLSSYAGSGIQLRFNRVTGSTWQADIAIDNISITASTARSNASATNKDITLSVFPNPVIGAELNILMNNKIDSSNAYEFEIKNFIGQLVRKGTVISTIDVSSLRSGVYFLQVATPDGNILMKRFLKN
ncbi:choice-of-anchor B family protein [Aquimarina aggregata]|uniref:choice-of-anchor B family protein n=1 Tax=Aquimarina aggregata TaxID=1642818 RepID=UPI0031EF7C66